MTTRNSSHLCLAAVVLLFILTGCSNRKKQEKSAAQQRRLPAGWVSLFDGKSLEGWKVTQFGPQGVVDVVNGELILGMGDGCTGVTYTGDFPEMNYEVSLEAKKVSGQDFFCGMTFPIDTTYCSLIVGGWGGPVVGLSTIDGLDGSENETRTLQKFETGTWYHIRLKVTPGKIEAWIDNEKLVDFNTEGHKLSIRPEVSLSRPFGICSWVTTAALRDIRLKEN